MRGYVGPFPQIGEILGKMTSFLRSIDQKRALKNKPRNIKNYKSLFEQKICSIWAKLEWLGALSEQERGKKHTESAEANKMIE